MDHFRYVPMSENELQAARDGRATPAPQLPGYVDTGYIRQVGGSYSRIMVRAPGENVFAPVRRYYCGAESMVYVPARVLRLVGNGNAAIILALLIYWNDLPVTGMFTGANCVTSRMPRAPRVEDHWFVTTRPRLSLLTGLTFEQVKRSLAKLCKRGLIITRPSHYQGRNVLLVRLDKGFLADVEATQKQELDCESGATTICQYPRNPLNFLRGGVTVLAGMVRMTGSANTAIVLGQIVYWHGDRRDDRSGHLRRHDDGQLWLAKEYRRLAEEIGLKINQVKLAIKQLKQAGLIETKVDLLQGRPTLHVRLIVDTFHRLWDQQAAALARMRLDSEL
jgi:DNA-binding MarR family transcriptional regulator